jgi:hypothetical protein
LLPSGHFELKRFQATKPTRATQTMIQVIKDRHPPLFSSGGSVAAAAAAALAISAGWLLIGAGASSNL